MKKILLKLLLTIFLLSNISISLAHAGGLALYEFGSPDVGLAAAGYAARAQDASTVFTNPAGMSRLEGTQVLVGAQALYGDVKFSPNSSTTVPGSDGGNAIGWLPGGSLFFVQPLSQDLRIGFGALSYFGLAESYDDNWVGRYYVQNAKLIGMTLTPALSYKVTDWLSIGAGLNAMYGYLKTQVAVNNVLGADGNLTYRDREWGYGANVGILVEPVKGTRFGLTYLSEVKLDFSAAPEFYNVNPLLGTVIRNRGLNNNLDIDVTVPQMVMFSAYHDLNSSWAVMANVGWQNWSKFGQVDIGINSNNPTSLTTNLNFKDTWHGAIGTQYRPSPAWTFSGGVAYDSSAVSDADRSVTLPMDAAWRFGLGAQYAIKQNLTVGFAYELQWIGDMSIDQSRGPLAGRVAGQYDGAYFHVFALNLSWKY